MACCTAILERCAPDGTVVLVFVDAETSTASYLEYPGLTVWAGDPTTLTNCAVGGADTTAIVDDGAGNVTITNPDTGDTTAMALADNADGTVSATIGGVTCALSAEDTELICDTPDPGVVTFRTTDLKTGTPVDVPFTAANRTSMITGNGSLAVTSATAVGSEAAVAGAVHTITVPCDMDLLVNAHQDIWHRNVAGAPDLGNLQGTVWEMLVYVDGANPVRISGILRANNKAASEETIISGTGCVPVTKGEHEIRINVRLFENTMPAGMQMELTQGVSTVQWTEMVCC